MICNCPKCNAENLLLDEVYLYINGKIWQCRKCRNAELKKYRQRPEVKSKRKLIIKNDNFKRTYRITLIEYNKLLEFYGNGCAICRKECSTGKSLAVDHDHNTKKIRGLLCMNCNTALGMMKENEELIWNMLEYLKRTTWDKKIA